MKQAAMNCLNIAVCSLQSISVDYVASKIQVTYYFSFTSQVTKFRLHIIVALLVTYRFNVQTKSSFL